MIEADLHLHSTASDGVVAPEKIGGMAASVGLKAIALTDHDTTRGLSACDEGCRSAGVAFVPGIEISADPKRDVGNCHLLGYFIDPANEQLAALCRRQGEARAHRAPEIIDRLRALGMSVTLDEVERIAGTSAVGRPHFAHALLQAGYVESLHEAFEKYLGKGRPAFVRKYRVDAEQAIRAIRAAGGIAVLGHPVQFRFVDESDCRRTIRGLVDLGLSGLESVHPDHSLEQQQWFGQLAAEMGLLRTGGSDWHGPERTPIGAVGVSYQAYQRLAEAAGR